MTATKEEQELMRHALGLGYRRRWAHRNYFAAADCDVPKWDSLVERGMATAAGNRPTQTMPYHLYSVTEAGARAAGVINKVPRKLLPRSPAAAFDRGETDA